MAWLAEAFGLEERHVVRGPDGKAMHAEMTFEGACVMTAWDELDAWLAEALGRLRISPRESSGGGSPAARWTWLGADERLDALLWPVVWAAARLLTSDEAHRIRVCAGPDCGWVYVDRSRNRLRRWCQMKTCGTAAKTRRRRRRQR